MSLLTTSLRVWKPLAQGRLSRKPDCPFHKGPRWGKVQGKGMEACEFEADRSRSKPCLHQGGAADAWHFAGVYVAVDVTKADVHAMPNHKSVLQPSTGEKVGMAKGNVIDERPLACTFTGSQDAEGGVEVSCTQRVMLQLSRVPVATEESTRKCLRRPDGPPAEELGKKFQGGWLPAPMYICTHELLNCQIRVRLRQCQEAKWVDIENAAESQKIARGPRHLACRPAVHGRSVRHGSVWRVDLTRRLHPSILQVCNATWHALLDQQAQESRVKPSGVGSPHVCRGRPGAVATAIRGVFATIHSDAWCSDRPVPTSRASTCCISHVTS